jgi:hypothetical protein
MSDNSEIKTEGFNEDQFIKPSERKLIDEQRPIYLAKGGTIKRFIPPFKEDYFIHCDVFTPNVGSSQSKEGVTDTMKRIPRPEKKFGKKS